MSCKEELAAKRAVIEHSALFVCKIRLCAGLISQGETMRLRVLSLYV